MKIDEKTQENVNLIQVYEQNLQSIVQQKQNFVSQLAEFDSAFQELQNSPKAYKIIGNIMVKQDIEKMKDEIASKKEMLEIRIKSIEKQEQKIKEKINDTQKKVMRGIKKK